MVAAASFAAVALAAMVLAERGSGAVGTAAAVLQAREYWCPAKPVAAVRTQSGRTYRPRSLPPYGFEKS
jgi:hypothetical protein